MASSGGGRWYHPGVRVGPVSAQRIRLLSEAVRLILDVARERVIVLSSAGMVAEVPR